MKILHVFDHSLPLQSGYTFRSMAILREQRLLGWETVHLTTPRHAKSAPSSPASQEDVDGFTFVRTPASDSLLSKTPLWPLAEMSATSRRLEAMARLERPDLLHAHSPSLNAHPAIEVGRRLGIPVVYEVRSLWEDAAVDHGTCKEDDIRYRMTRWHETLALRRVQQVTTICRGLSDEIVARGIEPGRVTVIPNAVDVERFRPAGPPDGALRESLGLQGAWVLGFCGSFYGYEGLDIALRAMPSVRESVPNAKLLLVGGGPEEQRLRRLASDLGLQNDVVFSGRVPNAEVNRYYAQIDALVFPRKRIRLTELVTPLKPLEAMAMGLPVIASSVGGHRELIRDRQTGLLFEPDDPQALAAAAVALHRDPALVESLRRQGHAFVEAERTWARSVGRYEGLYAAALAAMPAKSAERAPQAGQAEDVR